ncbi:MAG: peptidylprolyl isomerase, partial [Candidatus Sumerlaeota bacterium]
MKKRSILLLLAGLSVTAISMTPNVVVAQPATEAAAPDNKDAAEASPTPTPVPLNNDDKIVKIGDEELTVEQFTALAVLRPNPDERINPMTEIPIMRGERLEAFAKNAGAYDILAAEAKEKKLELDDRENKTIDDMMKGWRQYLVNKTLINDKMSEPSAADLDKIYEDQKEAAFAIKESLKLRQIFVSTYEDYTVKAGDSLESIAREVGGDEKLADQILDDTTKRPRAEKKLPATAQAAEAKTGDDAAKPAEQSLDPRALQDGEKLKVPVRGKKEEAAKEKIEKAKEKLDAGTSFEEVAKDISENENPGQLFEIEPGAGDRPIMPELQKSFMNLQDKHYSDPIRTRHGYSIIYRESYEPKSYVSRADSEARLKSIWETQKKTHLVDEFFEGQLNDDKVVKIAPDKLKQAKEEGGESVIFLTIGDKEFALSQLSQEAQSAIKDDKTDSPDHWKKFESRVE